jgi:hypothetical protein
MLPLLAAAGAGLASAGLSYYAGEKDRKRQTAAVNDYNKNSQADLDAYNAVSQNQLADYAANQSRDMNSPDGVNQWLNPYTDYQIGEINKANNMQYCGAGMLNSGAAMRSLQNRQQGYAAQNFKDAFGMMNTSNNQGLGAANSLYAATQGLTDNGFNAQNQIRSNTLAGTLGQPTYQQQIGDAFKAGGNGFNMFSNLTSMG